MLILVRNIKRAFTKLLLKVLDTYEIDERIKANRIAYLMAHATVGIRSAFYSTTQIHNLQQRPDNIVVGNDTHIRGELLLFKHGGKITIGDFVFIGEGSRVWSANEVVIGNHVLISHNVSISDTNVHETDYKLRAQGFEEIILSGHPSRMSHVETAPVFIDDYAWINFNAIILKGVKIGRGSIVAAGSVVTHDVDPFTLVAGNPARKIKDINA